VAPTLSAETVNLVPVVTAALAVLRAWPAQTPAQEQAEETVL
jgi:hypothetical protein